MNKTLIALLAAVSMFAFGAAQAADAPAAADALAAAVPVAADAADAPATHRWFSRSMMLSARAMWMPCFSGFPLAQM